MENSIHSLAALFALLLAWYNKNHGPEFLRVFNGNKPILFGYPGFHSIFLVAEDSHNYVVPGFKS